MESMKYYTVMITMASGREHELHNVPETELNSLYRNVFKKEVNLSQVLGGSTINPRGIEVIRHTEREYQREYDEEYDIPDEYFARDNN